MAEIIPDGRVSVFIDSNGNLALPQLNADGSLPVSSAPPVGGATSALQSAVQKTAGGAAAASSVQLEGVAGGTPVPVSAAALPLPTGAAIETGNLATLVARTPVLGAAAKAAAMPVTMATDQPAIPVSATGLSNIPAQGAAAKAASLPVTMATDQPAIAVSMTALPALATGSNTIGALTANQSVNVAQMNGVAPTMGSGTNGTGVQRVTIATDQAACSVAGLFSVSVNQTTDGTTNKVESAGLPTSAALNACTVAILSAAGAASAVKASAGNLYGFSILNNNAAVVWLEFFNTASVSLGTTTPVAAFPIPASQALSFPICEIALINNATAIYVAATTAYNGASTGSVSGSIFYK